ncbi:MAG TPA: DUF6328 family protein [Mycobacteriales bacterium]|nr:DUF6328 family protein [Mycobacteriales bacterium]
MPDRASGPDLPDEERHRTQHGETTEERLDRNFSELLQELRVAQAGVQILYAFLLSLAFTERFHSLSTTQRAIYLVALLSAAAAAALIIGPVSWHRVLFRQRRRADLVRASDRMATGGLLCVLVSVGAGVLLIVDVVIGRAAAVAITCGVVAWYGVFWYALPLWIRRRTPGQAP